jgi:hypothetical protein
MYLMGVSDATVAWGGFGDLSKQICLTVGITGEQMRKVFVNMQMKTLNTCTLVPVVWRLMHLREHFPANDPSRTGHFKPSTPPCTLAGRLAFSG